MSFTRQFSSLLRINLTGIPQRIGPVLTIVIGVTCAVGVLVSMLAMGVGARREAMGDVRPDRVVVRSIGARYPMMSSISKDVAYTIFNLPGVRQNSEHRPVAVAQAMIFTDAYRKSGGNRMYFPLLGVSSGLTEAVPELHLTAGRLFQPGLHEVIASNSCAGQYVGFEIGDKRVIRGADWIVVGHFDPGRSQGICIVYADADTVLSAFGRDNYNQLLIMLRSPADFDTFARAVKVNPTLHVEVKHESEIVAEQFKAFNGILNFASYFVGAIMALGATLGATNSLYAIVDARRRELATLRAIGFSPAPIIASILCESIAIGVPGALLGGILAWLCFNGFSASPFGFTFQLAVTPVLICIGVAWALIMGLIGGLLPALRAARVPVTTALRAV